jgi:hypothetical protein
VKLVILNYFSGIELTSLVYVGNGAKCNISPYKNVRSGSKIRAYVKNDLFQRESICALTYTLYRMHTHKARCTWLVMIWKVDNFKRFYLVPRLIERDIDHIWDEDWRMRLAQEYTLSSIPYDTVEDTWLMYYNIVLMTRMIVIHKKLYYKLEMTISSGNTSDFTQKPQYIGLNRCVPMMIFVIIFIY